MEIHISNIGQLQQAAKLFTEHIGNNRIFAFYGGMGAGKTTLIKAICEELGVEDVITSPTFAIVNEYTLNDEHTATYWGTKIYHFDFYRIHKIEEIYDMGVEEYFYSGNFCFIEWPELVEDILPADATRVYIKENADGSRTVKKEETV